MIIKPDEPQEVQQLHDSEGRRHGRQIYKLQFSKPCDDCPSESRDIGIEYTADGGRIVEEFNGRIVDGIDTETTRSEDIPGTQTIYDEDGNLVSTTKIFHPRLGPPPSDEGGSNEGGEGDNEESGSSEEED